mgnify:CR=1 FL=1
MWLALGAVIAGLVVLVWSADRFVDGASATARHAGMPTLLVGMLVIGFLGTGSTAAVRLMTRPMLAWQKRTR